MTKYIQHLDKGCEFATEYLKRQSSCEACPFPQCINEYPKGKTSFLKDQRDSEIRSLYREGKSKEELASLFKMSKRTISRVLEDYGEDDRV